jgi:hypothetical protein
MIKNNFKNSLIKQFKDSFSLNSKIRNYIFLGRSLPWSNEPEPILELDSFEQELDTWNNMLAIKRVKPEEVALCVRKILWETGTIYDQYDDVIDLYSDEILINFYVLTDEYNVYKCLSNNGGAISTDKPSGTGIDLIKTSDGYIWKYLYSIRPELELFISNDYMPVDFLDTFIYSETDLRNEQLAVELDTRLNHGGEISNITITQVGAPYLASINYNTYTPEDGTVETLHYVQSYSEATSSEYPNGFSKIGLNKRLQEISSVDDFYNDNYVIYISAGSGAGEMREITHYDATTGILHTNKKFSTQLNTSSSYKILPKVVITGDGNGASFIALTDVLTKKINEIVCLNPGKNYKSVDVEIKTSRTQLKDLTIVRAIKTPLIGHGGQAALELGCKSVMIRTTFDSRETDKLNFFNDYRQVGLIQNPTITNGLGEIERVVLDIEAFSATQDLNLLFNSPSGLLPVPFRTENLASLPGKYLLQGPFGDNPLTEQIEDQVVGIIQSYDPKTRILKVASIKNKFRINTLSNSEWDRLSLRNEGEVIPFELPYVKITKVVAKNNYNNNTFTNGMRIISDTSYTTAIVDSWLPNTDGISGKLVVKNINGKFLSSYYKTDGTLQKGEKLISLGINLSDPRFIVNGGLPKTGIIVNTLDTFSGVTEEIYRTTTVLEVSRSFGVLTPFTDATFTRDSYLKQIDLTTGETIAIGTIVDWNINITDPTQTKGTLILNMIEGEFIASTQKNLYELISSDYSNVQDTIVCTVTPSEVEKYTGNMLYIDNHSPIQHSKDTLEEIKLVIGF